MENKICVCVCGVVCACAWSFRFHELDISKRSMSTAQIARHESRLQSSKNSHLTTKCRTNRHSNLELSSHPYIILLTESQESARSVVCQIAHNPSSCCESVHVLRVRSRENTPTRTPTCVALPRAAVRGHQNTTGIHARRTAGTCRSRNLGSAQTCVVMRVLAVHRVAALRCACCTCKGSISTLSSSRSKL